MDFVTFRGKVTRKLRQRKKDDLKIEGDFRKKLYSVLTRKVGRRGATYELNNGKLTSKSTSWSSIIIFAIENAGTQVDARIDYKALFENFQKGEGDREVAYALYYWLHTYHIVDEANSSKYYPYEERAIDIDRSLFGRSQRRYFSKNEPIIVSGNVQPTARTVDCDAAKKNIESSTSFQPRLLPPLSNKSIHYFGSRKLDVLGREDEVNRLRDFLKCDMQFAWFQLAGAGGQGKSRLAYDLMIEAEAIGWKSGFLRDRAAERFKGKWESWQPHKPHLIIVDYVVGFEAYIKPLIDALAPRSNHLRENVRLLLLERQRFDRGSLKAVPDESGSDGITLLPRSDRYATWYLKLTENRGDDVDLIECRFQDGVVELLQLNPHHLADIVEQVASLESGERINIDKSRVIEFLHRIDKSGRPLYAYFLGQQLAIEPEKVFETREKLLNDALYREYEKRWRLEYHKNPPRLSEDTPSMRIAALATIVGRLRLSEDVDYETLRSALVLSDSPQDDDGVSIDRWVNGLQPDILGTWFVLNYFTSGSPTEEVLNDAWEYSPKSTIFFLLRALEDFPENPSTELILNYILSADKSWEYVLEVSAEVFFKLFLAELKIPRALIKGMANSAKKRDIDSMYCLGFFYLVDEVKCDYETRIERWIKKISQFIRLKRVRYVTNWRGLAFRRETVFRQTLGVGYLLDAANEGHVESMRALGNAYRNSDYYFLSYESSFLWFRKAAEAGDIESMYEIGIMLTRGIGVEKDEAKGVLWLKRAADRGHIYAESCLGVVFPNYLEHD